MAYALLSKTQGHFTTLRSTLINLLFGRDELSRLFVTLLQQRKAVGKLRLHSKRLDKEAEALRQGQAKNTVQLMSSISSYNGIRAALTKSFDLEVK